MVSRNGCRNRRNTRGDCGCGRQTGGLQYDRWGVILGVGAAEAAETGAIVFAVGIGDAVASGAMAGAVLGGAVGAVAGVVVGGYYFYHR